MVSVAVFLPLSADFRFWKPFFFFFSCQGLLTSTGRGTWLPGRCADLLGKADLFMDLSLQQHSGDAYLRGGAAGDTLVTYACNAKNWLTSRKIRSSKGLSSVCGFAVGGWLAAEALFADVAVLAHHRTEMPALRLSPEKDGEHA